MAMENLPLIGPVNQSGLAIPKSSSYGQHMPIRKRRVQIEHIHSFQGRNKQSTTYCASSISAGAGSIEQVETSHCLYS